MNKPILLTVDDDAAVSQAITRTLRRQYADRFRVLRADSGLAALETLRELKLSGDEAALLLADHRMPGMTGVALLEQAIEFFPDAKRVLLTAYADIDVAIRAINTVGLDYYLLKPWDPPEEKLYPVLDDLLDDWLAHYEPPFEGVRVIGHRWSARSHEVKDLLAGNHVPFLWLDVESDAKAQEMLTASGVSASPERLPVVVTTSGAVLEAPTNADLAANIGLLTRAELPFYDLTIIGAGPAGLAAAVYGASEGLRTILLERQAPGGQAGQSSRIENYLGFPAGVSGSELARRALTQARRFGAEMITVQEACALEARGPARIVRLSSGAELSSHTVLIATGVSYRRLEAPGFEEFVGQGVYYGASVAEAQRTRDQDVYIIGGANSAGQAAVYFSRFARSVTLVVRADRLEKSMSHYLIEQIRSIPTIHVRVQSEVVAVGGSTHLETITIADRSAGRDEVVPTNFLFVLIGAYPHTEWIGEAVARDAQGFILSGAELLRPGAHPRWTATREPYLLETSLAGVFVAGDARSSSMKRVASAVGEGAMAVQLVHQYLDKM
ncbi:MAG: Thioredoxin reductase [Ktedonobacterales bacterium]|jgi:thioredoxin reductase (NADPH)|nr:MAG: Thioredoxin reductase [Ktedonobacterales bacterium]